MNRDLFISRLTFVILMCLLPASPGLANLFDDPVESAAGVQPQSLALADFNQDGTLDLVAVGGLASILLGNGDGTFQAPVTYPHGGSGNTVAVGDLNLDARLDLAVTNEDDDRVAVLLGNGDGTFQPWTGYPMGQRPMSVLIVDLDLNGYPDLVASNYYSNTVSVLLGDGSGTFPAGQEFPAGENPSAMATGDLDLDGNPDLAVVNPLVSDLAILFGNGDGTFDPPDIFSGGFYPWKLDIADLNLDGFPDLVQLNWWDLGSLIYLGDGTGSFEPTLYYSLGGLSLCQAIDDFDRDGIPDVAYGEFLPESPPLVEVLLGQGDGTYRERVQIDTSSREANLLVAGDLNNDGFSDLVFGNNFGDRVFVLLNLGSTVSAEISCVPNSGILPFSTLMAVTLENRYDEQRRRIGATIHFRNANYIYHHDWRTGFMNILPGQSKTIRWNQYIPAAGSYHGDNRFILVAEDITPAPWNQPPYPPAGHTDFSDCTVTGIAP